MIDEPVYNIRVGGEQNLIEFSVWWDRRCRLTVNGKTEDFLDPSEVMEKYVPNRKIDTVIRHRILTCVNCIRPFWIEGKELKPNEAC